MIWPCKTDRYYAQLITLDHALSLEHFAKLEKSKLSTASDQTLDTIVRKCSVVVLDKPLHGEIKVNVSNIREPAEITLRQLSDAHWGN